MADLSNVAGPESMAMPTSSTAPASSHNEPGPSAPAPAPKRKKHRGGRNKRKKAQQNFNALSEGTHEPAATEGINDPPRPTQAAPFYRVRSRHGSNTSLESEALLDHREHTPLRPRRQVRVMSIFRPRDITIQDDVSLRQLWLIF
jgi:magnesium transporter